MGFEEEKSMLRETVKKLSELDAPSLLLINSNVKVLALRSSMEKANEAKQKG